MYEAIYTQRSVFYGFYLSILDPFAIHNILTLFEVNKHVFSVVVVVVLTISVKGDDSLKKLENLHRGFSIDVFGQQQKLG